MSRRVYISADYAPNNGDSIVVDEIHKWCDDPRRKLSFYDTANPSCGSISSDPDCRPCDLKKEFNQQINASSAVIFVVGDKTAQRTAGSFCRRNDEGAGCECTPYKQNTKGKTTCKWQTTLNVEKYLTFLLTQRPHAGMTDDELKKLVPWSDEARAFCGFAQQTAFI